MAPYERPERARWQPDRPGARLPLPGDAEDGRAQRLRERATGVVLDVLERYPAGAPTMAIHDGLRRAGVVPEAGQKLLEDLRAEGRVRLHGGRWALPDDLRA